MSVRDAVFMAQQSLPEGWRYAPYSARNDDIYVVTAPSVGSVTIDFAHRCYRAGVVIGGSGLGLGGRRDACGPNHYWSRGWRQRLFDDAIAWLTKVGNERKGRRVQA